MNPEKPQDVAALSKRNPNRVRTENVWPWSHLIPWFIQDMKERVRVHELSVLGVCGRSYLKVMSR